MDGVEKCTIRLNSARLSLSWGLAELGNNSARLSLSWGLAELGNYRAYSKQLENNFKIIIVNSLRKVCGIGMWYW